MVNNIILKGCLTDTPYFDVIPESETPFMRLYLGVNLRAGGLALTLLHGNLSQPPYFDYVPPNDRPFMRFYLAVGRPGRDDADFLRVVAYDDRALFDYPYLRTSSELLVKGNLRARRRKSGGGRKTQTVVEVVVDPLDGITFLDKIAWDQGDAARERILQERAAHPKSTSNGRQELGGGIFRVVAYGDHARHDFPYLRKGSEVFVQGRIQTRKRTLDSGKRETVVEIIAQNITFLRDIDWDAGDAARRVSESGAVE